MTYLTREVADLLAVRPRTLAYWVTKGLLSPAGARRGRRYPAAWGAKDVREATVLVACRRAGVSLQGMRRAIDYWRSVGHTPFSTGEFVVVRTGDGEPAELIKICTSGEMLALIRDPGQVVMPFPKLEERDDGAINKG